MFDASTVGLSTSEGAGLGAAIQAVDAVLSSLGTPAGYSELTARLVALDEATRCEPVAENVERYGELQAKQGELMRCLAGADFL